MYIWILWGSWLLSVVAATVLRNRYYAIFMGINLAICTAVWAGLFGVMVREGVWWVPAIYVLQGLTFVHYVALTRPRLRPLWYRGLISIPGLWFAAATWLAFPWAIAAACGATPYGWWLPFVICLVGVYQSLRNRVTHAGLLLNGQDVGKIQRVPVTAAPVAATAQASEESSPSTRQLRIVQIADPHLGPFMSAARLRGICARAMETQPDLVLITGDLLTMESQAELAQVKYALEPLASMQGRIFGCLGNHDHEAPRTIEEVFQHIGGRLLIDESELVETPIGPVEIIGADFVYRKRRDHLAGIFGDIGLESAHPRILLLHDPAAFRHVPDGAADLTLAGHSHGGQLGLQSLGIPWTLIGMFTRAPDYGFWGKGRNRLYVHRGNGHYGFPLRLGVSGEEGSLLLTWPAE